MFQLKRAHIVFLLLLLTGTGFVTFVRPQGYDDAFELRNKLKIELQYADYGEYEYPEPIVYRYGLTEYRQLQPYIANFPEKRGLLKFTRLVDDATAIGAKYQYSDIKADTRQHLVEMKITRNLDESVTGLAAVQFVRDTRGFNSYQGGTGAMWNLSVLTTLQGEIQYFYRGGDATIVGGRMSTVNTRMKFRQVLTLSTALLCEYNYYNAQGSSINFGSHGVALWLSQYLPTETAVHLTARYYTNSIGIRSFAPSVELAQYIDWATVLWLKFRYYTNKSDDVSLGEQNIIVPDGLLSLSYSAQVNREIGMDLLLYAKYRYYRSNLHVQMNTYMFGAVYSF